jgi:hypothetical protein
MAKGITSQRRCDGVQGTGTREGRGGESDPARISARDGGYSPNESHCRKSRFTKRRRLERPNVALVVERAEKFQLSVNSETFALGANPRNDVHRPGSAIFP